MIPRHRRHVVGIGACLRLHAVPVIQQTGPLRRDHGSILMLFSVLLACLGGCPSPGAVYDFCCFYKPVVATHTIGQAEATEVQQIFKFGPH